MDKLALLFSRGFLFIVIIFVIGVAVTKSAAAQEQIPLQAMSDQGTFRVEILWTTNEIDRANTFEISFIEPETGIEIEDIKYDIAVFRDNSRNPEVRRVAQISTMQEFRFEEQGSYTIQIGNIEDLGEGVSFPIQVTPEFPMSALFLVGTVVTIPILIARSKRNNLFRKQDID